MHILYLVPHVPNPTKSRSYPNIHALHQQGHRVTVVTLERSAADKRYIQALQDAGIHVVSVYLSRW